MKIAIIGAGWYGCHIATTLLQHGHNVSVYEKSNSVISGASRYNQNRLHIGYHYPRNYETRKQSKVGFDWFIEHYGGFTEAIELNLYGIAAGSSIVDATTYAHIMNAMGLGFEEIKSEGILKQFKGLERVFKTEERVIKNEKARVYFNDILSNHLVLNEIVDLKSQSVRKALESQYDYIIDCTWGSNLDVELDSDVFYESCIYFYYKNICGDFAITVMDGDYFSLYPYQNDIYTLTSVKDTPILVSNSVDDVNRSILSATNDTALIQRKRSLFEEVACHFYSGFKSEYEYVGHQFSRKTKFVSGSDFRGTKILRDDKVLHVLSGKIDTLHVAEELLKKEIGYER